jgi:DNA-binding response OmpR family regulator
MGGHRLAELEAHGLTVSQCTDMPQLYSAARQAVERAKACAVLLASGHSENCVVAAQLRTLYPSLGVVAITPSSLEAVWLQALQSGVDHICPASAPPQLLAAILFRLLWRLDVAAASVAASGHAVWSLVEHGWILASPEGQRIPLTTGERAFLTALIAAPNQRAAHADLINAVNDAYALESAAAMQSRISVLVSRLRRKCAEHGVGLPLKSVHNWGYMFTGAL